MKRLHALFSLVLVLVTTLLVSCSGPQVQVPTTYSPEKIAQLQVYAEPLTVAKEQLETIPDLLAKENWVDTITLIHGPLGQLRAQMLGLSRSLLPKDQPTATELAKEVFGHLEQLDAAAKERSVYFAKQQYGEALKDFDSFIQLIPQADS